MKKIFLATIVVSLLSVSAFGLDGKIGMIKADQPNDRIIIGLVDADGNQIAAKKLIGNSEQIKAALALALTAKSTNADVTLVEVAGSGGWSNVIIK